MLAEKQEKLQRRTHVFRRHGTLDHVFLALVCEGHITRALRAAHDHYAGPGVTDGTLDARPLSAVVALRELADVRAVPVRVGAQTLWVRTDIKGHVAILFRRLGIRTSPKLLKRDAVVAHVEDHATSV